MREKLYCILKIVIWCVIGIYIASSIYQCIHYICHPQLYSAWSAPWYTGIIVRGIGAAAIAGTFTLLLKLLKRKK